MTSNELVEYFKKIKIDKKIIADWLSLSSKTDLAKGFIILSLLCCD